jgi:hypothetical protein
MIPVMRRGVARKFVTETSMNGTMHVLSGDGEMCQGGPSLDLRLYDRRVVLELL